MSNVTKGNKEGGKRGGKKRVKQSLIEICTHETKIRVGITKPHPSSVRPSSKFRAGDAVHGQYFVKLKLYDTRTYTRAKQEQERQSNLVDKERQLILHDQLYEYAHIVCQTVPVQMLRA